MFREIRGSCRNLSEIKFVIKISLANMCYVREMKFIKIEKKKKKKNLYDVPGCRPFYTMPYVRVIPMRNKKVSDILVYNLFIIRR